MPVPRYEQKTYQQPISGDFIEILRPILAELIVLAASSIICATSKNSTLVPQQSISVSWNSLLFQVSWLMEEKSCMLPCIVVSAISLINMLPEKNTALVQKRPWPLTFSGPQIFSVNIVDKMMDVKSVEVGENERDNGQCAYCARVRNSMVSYCYPKSSLRPPGNPPDPAWGWNSLTSR